MQALYQPENWRFIALGIAGLIFLLITSQSLKFTRDVRSGIAIRLHRYFKEGDYITVSSGITGRVRQIGVTHTIIDDREHLISCTVHNDEIATHTITNHSEIGGHWVDVYIPVVDIGTVSRSAVTELMTSAVQDSAMYPYTMRSKVAVPYCWLNHIEEDIEVYLVRTLVSDEHAEYRQVIAGRLFQAIISRLEDGGITIKRRKGTGV